MSRVSLGASLLVAIGCLSLLNYATAQTEGGGGGDGNSGEPEASATGGEGGYAGEMGGEYGGRGGYGIAAATDALESSAISDEESAGETAREDHRGESATARIEAALDEQLKSPLQYEDQPLNEVIDTLQEEYDIPILFDVAALEEVAIAPETEVTINLRDISLRSALNLMLRQPGLEDLTVVIDEEVLLITTEEKANEKMTVEVYRVDDLIRGYRPPGEGNVSPYTSLTEVITRCVAYDTWMVNESGEGEVRLMQPGLLVVTNTRQVHDQVQGLLEKLRSTRAAIDQDRGSDGSYGGREGRSGGGYGEF